MQSMHWVSLLWPYCPWMPCSPCHWAVLPSGRLASCFNCSFYCQFDHPCCSCALEYLRDFHVFLVLIGFTVFKCQILYNNLFIFLMESHTGFGGGWVLTTFSCGMHLTWAPTFLIFLRLLVGFLLFWLIL